jgi:hypothetical protein
MTCAFWEAFIEDLASDALTHLASHAESAIQLPKDLQKSVVEELQRRKHELAMWELAGDRWRNLLRDRAERIISINDRTLNSPTSKNVDDFLRVQAGMPCVSGAWHWHGTAVIKARQRLDDFVGLRNKIAHRGTADVAVLRRDAERGFELVKRLTACSLATVDRQLLVATGKPLIERTPLGRQPELPL